jgi:lipoprotein-anchoring transpeptidase ErfK/SrfK
MSIQPTAGQTFSTPREKPRGTIVVDPLNHYLYYVESGGQARRYGIAVGGEGFGWSGVAMVHSKSRAAPLARS